MPPLAHPRDLMCAYEVTFVTMTDEVDYNITLDEALAQISAAKRIVVPNVQTWDEGLEFAKLLADEHAERCRTTTEACGGQWQTGYTFTTDSGTHVFYTVRPQRVEFDSKNNS